MLVFVALFLMFLNEFRYALRLAKDCYQLFMQFTLQLNLHTSI